VCKLWNQVVNDTPFFWAVISWGAAEGTRKRKWDLYLSRSKGLPLAINCWDGYSPTGKALSASSLLRWAIAKSVRIWRFRFRDRRGAYAWALVRPVLAQTSLDLREIELVSNAGTTLFKDNSFLGAHVPKLQSLTLDSVIVPWTLCAIPTLRKLSISFTYKYLEPRDSNRLPTSVDILSILASTPVLETLHLAGINQDQAQSSTGFSNVSIPQLKELVAEGVSSGALRSLAESLDFHQTARVNFTIGEPRLPRINVHPETEFAQIVSRLAGCGLLQDCHLELEKTALQASSLRHEVRLLGEGNIDYKKAFKVLSKQAVSQVVSAGIRLKASDDSRELLEAIHDTFPDIIWGRIWKLARSSKGSKTRNQGHLPESLFPKLTAIEAEIDRKVDLDFSEVLAFIRARNSPNQHEEGESRPHPILRLRITAPSKRIPAPQRSIWKEIEALVTRCQFMARREDEEEDAVSPEEGSEDEIKPDGSSDFE
ncbi:hypothetical protein FRC01_012711, partial [Tulasnella sp. 417]